MTVKLRIKLRATQEHNASSRNNRAGAAEKPTCAGLREGFGVKVKNTSDSTCDISQVLPDKYRITLPDPGEYERGMTPEDDIILSVPAQREEEFYKGVEYQTTHGTVNSFYPTMKEEFSRPPFYNTIFEAWGLMTGAEWDKTKKLF